MTKADAQRIVEDLFGAFYLPLREEAVDAYVEALERFPAPETSRAIREYLNITKDDRVPTVPALLAIIRRSEARTSDEAPTYTKRGSLKLRDYCVQCQKRITDREFEEHDWDFTPWEPLGMCPQTVTGYLHNHCKHEYCRANDLPERFSQQEREAITQAWQARSGTFATNIEQGVRESRG